MGLFSKKQEQHVYRKPTERIPPLPDETKEEYEQFKQRFNKKIEALQREMRANETIGETMHRERTEQADRK